MAKAKGPLRRKEGETCSGQAKLGEERSDGVDANEHVMTFTIYSCDTAGNSNTTSFPVSRRYTDENESSLYSSDVASFESRNLSCVSRALPHSPTLTLSAISIHQRQHGSVFRQSPWGKQDPPRSSRAPLSMFGCAVSFA